MITFQVGCGPWQRSCPCLKLNVPLGEKNDLGWILSKGTPSSDSLCSKDSDLFSTLTSLAVKQGAPTNSSLRFLPARTFFVQRNLPVSGPQLSSTRIKCHWQQMERRGYKWSCLSLVLAIYSFSTRTAHWKHWPLGSGGLWGTGGIRPLAVFAYTWHLPGPQLGYQALEEHHARFFQREIRFQLVPFSKKSMPTHAGGLNQ